MATAEYQEKYLWAVEAKEMLYSSCRKLTGEYAPRETAGIRNAANAFFSLFVAGTASERLSGGHNAETLSAARQMADLFMEGLAAHHNLKELSTLPPGAVRCIANTILLRIVHPEVEAHSYDVGGAVRFEGLSGKQPLAVSIAATLITDAVIEPASIEINSKIGTVKIKFESSSFLLDELFSALLLGRVNSIVRRKRDASEEFANMIESMTVERKG